MKKNIYDQEDRLFLAHFKKQKEYGVSKEDKDLFKTWVNCLDKDKSELKNIISNISVQKLEKKRTPDDNWENSNTLFKTWVENNSNKVDQYISYKSDLNPHQKKYITPTNIIPTIDLHGYTREEAIFNVKNFIKNIPKHHKKARIIHGKGLTHGKPSIIRTEVRNWLSYEKKHHTWLIDFSYETPQNGGHGATVIWIKQGEYHDKY